MWKRFASILRSMRSVGFATIIDLDAYDGLATAFKAKRQPKYHDPYYLAFQQQVETMALRMAKMRRTEGLSIFFDQRSGKPSECRHQSSNGMSPTHRARHWIKQERVHRHSVLTRVDGRSTPGMGWLTITSSAHTRGAQPSLSSTRPCAHQPDRGVARHDACSDTAERCVERILC